MFSIVACPRCAGQVSISSGASPTAHVCCPLCDSQYPLSELLAALPPALIIVDSPAEAHDAEDLLASPLLPPAADSLSHAVVAPAGTPEDEFDLSPVAPGEPDSLEAEYSLEGSEPLDEADIAVEVPNFAEPEHAGFQDHELHAAGEPPETAEGGFEDAGFDDAPGPGSPYAEHDPEELPEMEFAAADEFAAPGDEFSAPGEHDFAAPGEHDFAVPGEHDFAAPADEFSAPGEHDFSAPEGDEFSAPGELDFAAPGEHEFSAPGEHDFAAPGEHDFSAPAEDEFSAPGEHAFAPNEEGGFGDIEQGFQHEMALQPGEYQREAGEDAGEEIGMADEFSLPSPGAPPEAPAKGKKGAKAAKAAKGKPAKGKSAKVKASKSDKPRRSFVGTLFLMLTVPLFAVLFLVGIYMGMLWGTNRDVLELAGIKMADKLPPWAVPKAFHKASHPTMLAGGPGMPPVNPLSQPAADLSEPGNPAPGNPAAMPAEEPAANAAPGDNAASTPDSLDVPPSALTGRKPVRQDDAKDMPAEKPGDAAADDELLAGLKPKPKAPDDGVGAEPEEKMPAKKKSVENDELAGDEKKPAGDLPGADEKMLDDPLGNKGAAKKVVANKVPEEDLLPGEVPAGKSKPGAKPDPEMKDELGLDGLAGKKPKAPADEPPKDDPLADPIAPPVTPLDVPAYTLADLDQALADVVDSTATMAAADTLAPDDLKKARAQYYRRFYRLGEVMTFAEDDAAALRLGDEKVAVITLLRKTGSNEEKLAQIGRAATKWLAFSKRGEHAGILLGGTVAEIVHDGKLYEVKIAVPGVEQPVSVFSGTKPKVVEEDRVILLGSVVDDPTANLPGYEGTQPAVVWNGLTVKLPAEAAAEESK